MKDNEHLKNVLSELLRDVIVNETVCNGTDILQEIIVNHTNEIQKTDLKNGPKISNETDEYKNTTFSVHDSKHCFEKFKVYIFKIKYFRLKIFLKEYFRYISARCEKLV